MSLKDDIKDVPSWVWLGGAAAAGVVFFLHARSGASGSSAASVPLTSGSGQVGAVQSGLTADGTLPSQQPAPSTTPAPAGPAGVSFSSWLNQGLGGLNSTAGFSINGSPTATRDWAQTATQFGQDNPAYQAWAQQLQQLYTHSDPNIVRPDVQAALLAQGTQYLSDPTISTQYVPGLGTQTAQAAPIPAGGGGFSYHPAATQTGSMSDAFGLQSPTNPSIHG